MLFMTSGVLRADLSDDANEAPSIDGSRTHLPKLENGSTKAKENAEGKKSLNRTQKDSENSSNQRNASPPKGQKSESKSKKEHSGSREDEKARDDNSAGVAGNSDASRKEPIYFKSDGKSTYTKEGDVIFLEKNVVITQANLRFRADTAKVYLEKDGDENSVRMAEFSGHVDVNKSSDDPAEEVTASGNKAQFFNDTRKVELIGNAHLWRGGHLIKGKQITYFVDTGMITVDEAQGVVKPESAKKK